MTLTTGRRFVLLLGTGSDHSATSCRPHRAKKAPASGEALKSIFQMCWNCLEGCLADLCLICDPKVTASREQHHNIDHNKSLCKNSLADLLATPALEQMKHFYIKSPGFGSAPFGACEYPALHRSCALVQVCTRV
mmetsp:Transcript_15520/g.23084  ORF Transcript_15520/g.23084 Transcript_15520/m.23084 type:complete len:135 (-) Transcript_15520:96-500(-)